MKVFVCGDIHGNVRALDAVLEVYRREYPCDFLFLGDCVGYGPHPDACLDRILNLPRARLLMGNHDSALFNHDERGHMNDLAVQALFWSEDVIKERFGGIIHERLRLEYGCEHYIAAHASPVRTREWPYIFTILDANEVFYKKDFKVCFVGHTHVQTIFSFRNGEIRPEQDIPFEMDPWDRYIINPGSVGQPRDLDPRASCCVFDTAASAVTFHRCAYDVAAEVEDFSKAGLPEFLGRRLLEGM